MIEGLCPRRQEAPIRLLSKSSPKPARKLRGAAAAVVLLLIAAACSSSSEPDSAATTTTTASAPVDAATPAAIEVASDSPKPVIVDTDMGADDVMALLFLLQSPAVEVLAITVSGTGLVHCDPGARHVNDLLAVVGASGIPVACGRETPLQGDRAFPAAWRADADRLFGVSLPEGAGEISQLGAVELMASVLESSAEPVTVLTLGPPTNLADLLIKSPDVVDEIDLIYASGGALEAPGAAASGENEPAEWNFYIDAEAARTVLNSGALVTLVPLDAADDVPITPELAGMLGDPPFSPAVGVITEMIGGNPALSGPDFFMWDLLTAAVFADEALAVFEMKRVALAGTAGEESGVVATSVDDGARIRVAVSAVRDRFDAVFLHTLDPEGAGASGSTDPNDITVEAFGDSVWEFSMDGSCDCGAAFSHSSAAVADGVVYLGGSNGTVYALNSESGAMIWELAVGEDPVPPEGVQVPSDFRFAVNGPMALSERAVVFKVRGDPEGLGSMLMAVDRETGGELWRFVPPEGEARVRGPAIADGVVFTGTSEFLYALDSETGAELWRFRPEGGAPDPAARVAVAEGVAYFGTPAGLVYAVDIATHQELWSFQTGFGTNGVASRPAIVDGIAYFGSDDATFYAVDTISGEEIWRFTAPGALPSSPTVAGDRVFFGVVSGDGLVALDRGSGDELWRADLGGIISSPVVSEGAVYVGSGDGNLYAVDAATGDVLWRFRTENVVGNSPAVVDGVVYFQSGLSFYAVKAPS
jgi:pyrimidine-specific ribonucleoside hydrolase